MPPVSAPVTQAPEHATISPVQQALEQRERPPLRVAYLSGLAHEAVRRLEI